MRNRWLRTYNRTIEELKLGYARFFCRINLSYNRTIEELKFVAEDVPFLTVNTYNRTIEELKCKETGTNSGLSNDL